MLETTLTRADRRKKVSERRQQIRLLKNGERAYWEWSHTQEHPAKKRSRNRRKNRVARASRKKNRR